MDAVELALIVADLRAEGSDLAEVEVKRASGGYPENVAETLSAFGNTPGGGLLVFGLDEASNFDAVGSTIRSPASRPSRHRPGTPSNRR